MLLQLLLRPWVLRRPLSSCACCLSATLSCQVEPLHLWLIFLQAHPGAAKAGTPKEPQWPFCQPLLLKFEKTPVKSAVVESHLGLGSANAAKMLHKVISDSKEKGKWVPARRVCFLSMEQPVTNFVSDLQRRSACPWQASLTDLAAWLYAE